MPSASGERTPRARRFVVALGTLATLLAGPPAGAAEPHSLADFELYTYRRAPRALRESALTFGGGYGVLAGPVFAYVGGGAGVATVHARVGLAVFPSDLYSGGLVMRVEARPALLQFRCFDPAVLFNAGIGWRWALEYRRSDEPSGPGLHVMPAFEGGPGWPGYDCNGGPRGTSFYYGGTVATGLDW